MDNELLKWLKGVLTWYSLPQLKMILSSYKTWIYYSLCKVKFKMLTDFVILWITVFQTLSSLFFTINSWILTSGFIVQICYKNNFIFVFQIFIHAKCRLHNTLIFTRNNYYIIQYFRPSNFNIFTSVTGHTHFWGPPKAGSRQVTAKLPKLQNWSTFWILLCTMSSVFMFYMMKGSF